jgi:hypothetical protein
MGVLIASFWWLRLTVTLGLGGGHSSRGGLGGLGGLSSIAGGGGIGSLLRMVQSFI